MPKHAYDSTEQQNAEAYLLKHLEINLECSFSNERTLPVHLSVKPDAIDLENKVIVEVFARVGELKGAQLQSTLAADSLLSKLPAPQVNSDSWVLAGA